MSIHSVLRDFDIILLFLYFLSFETMGFNIELETEYRST